MQAKPSSLHAAAKAGDAEAVRELLGGGADADQADARGISALGVAVGFNRLPAVRALLAGGAAVGQRDGRGNTVLHYAAGARARPTRAPICSGLQSLLRCLGCKACVAAETVVSRRSILSRMSRMYLMLSAGLPGKEHHRA
jgi:hypothetical protein